LILRVGVPNTMFILGVAYFLIMISAAQVLRRPATGWQPAGWTPSGYRRRLDSGVELTMPEAVRTPQFWLMWLMLCINVTAGISILSQASPMMQDMFGRTPTEAAAFVGIIALANAGGRFFWASASDYVGRRTVFATFFAVQSILFYLIPELALSGRWGVFQIVLLVIFTMYGGGFATIPAFLADRFGAKYVGAVHGVILTAWSAAGVLGPVIITRVRNAKLATLPPGASRVELYQDTLHFMSALLVVGLIATMLVRPVRRPLVAAAEAAD
jgi:nitrate/nitrite transporter NarK